MSDNDKQEKARLRKRKSYEKNREKWNEQRRQKRAEIKEKFGFEITYLHKYMRKLIGESEVCFICNKIIKTELACVDHIYTKNPKMWMWLCRSCHQIYDNCRGVANES